MKMNVEAKKQFHIPFSNAFVKSKVEWTDYGVNLFCGCRHGCTYCYARKMHDRRCPGNWNKPVLRKSRHELIEDISKEVSKVKDKRIAYSVVTDPYQFGSIREFLEPSLESSNDVLILTKSTDIIDDYGFLSNYDNVQVGFTITALKKIHQERDVSSNAVRIKALAKAKKLGIRTFVSIEPWIPYVTNPLDIIKSTEKFCDFVILGRLNWTKDNLDHYYLTRVGEVVSYLEGKGIDYLVKKELRNYLVKRD